jgi:molybdate transport system substrate-binding protein
MVVEIGMYRRVQRFLRILRNSVPGAPLTTAARVLAAILMTTSAPFALSQSITVAAAADLTNALTPIAANYQKATGREVKLSFGASGNLTTQIQNGAPFDLFFSADEDYPKKLINAGLADPTSLYRYALGKLVLWIPASSALDVEHRGLQALLDPSVTRIAIANPQHAPYGRAAEAALRHEGVYDQVSGKLVVGENVAQAAQFVESGNAQAGLVALSAALASPMKEKGRYWQVPLQDYPALNQAAVVLSHSIHKEAAQAFLDYLKQPETVTLLQRYGFSVAGEAPK